MLTLNRGLYGDTTYIGALFTTNSVARILCTSFVWHYLHRQK